MPQQVARRPRSEPSDPAASTEAARMFRDLYGELHRLATGCMSTQPRGHTLQTTALINEAFLRLSRQAPEHWSTRQHFMSLAARAMRSVLVDHARRKRAEKRNTQGARMHLDLIVQKLEERSVDILDLDEALTELEKLGEHQARAVRVVELRFLCGLTVGDAARALGQSERTLHRDWQFARAWLGKKLR